MELRRVKFHHSYGNNFENYSSDLYEPPKNICMIHAKKGEITMKKKIALFALAMAIITGSLGTCAFAQITSMSVGLTASSVYKKVTAGFEGPTLVKMNKTMFADQYGIKTKYLESYTVMTPMMNVQATEYAIFKVKSKTDIARVKAGINKRAGYLENVWKQYLPYQYELVKNRKVVVKGKYVLFVISENRDKAISNFKKSVK
jgi:hypothetical protein